MTSVIEKNNIVDLEVFPNQAMRATLGSVSSGRIVQINNFDVAKAQLSSDDIVQLIKTIKIERLVVSTDTTINSASSTRTSPETTQSMSQIHSSFRFLELPDGNVGITVSTDNNSPSQNTNSVCIEGLTVVRTSPGVVDFSTGDVIVSVNDIPLVGVSTEGAARILGSAENRRVTVLRGGGSSSNSNKNNDGLTPEMKAYRDHLMRFGDPHTFPLRKNSFPIQPHDNINLPPAAATSTTTSTSDSDSSQINSAIAGGSSSVGSTSTSTSRMSLNNTTNTNTSHQNTALPQSQIQSQSLSQLLESSTVSDISASYRTIRSAYLSRDKVGSKRQLPTTTGSSLLSSSSRYNTNTTSVLYNTILSSSINTTTTNAEPTLPTNKYPRYNASSDLLAALRSGDKGCFSKAIEKVVREREGTRR